MLGLTIDRKLGYVEHGNYVYKKVLSRWVGICKYSNRNWGFRQHVIVRLVEVLVSSCIQYAGFIWINAKSLTKIEQIWYKMLKSAIGAVFNIRQGLAEVILGMPPISVTAAINGIKHTLKLKIADHNIDPLRDLMDDEVKRTFGRSVNRMKEVFNFLDWKLQHYPIEFNSREAEIVQSKVYEEFFSLSMECCQYTKTQIRMYTEKVWQERVNNQFIHDGFVSAPTVSTTKLKIPTTDRNKETLLMSLFYDNNLMNGFLSRTLGLSFCSPHCSCNLWKVEDTQHVLLECLHVKPWKRRIMSNYLEGVSQNIPDFHIILTNCSRDSTFVKLAMDIIDDCHGYLRKEIVLPSR